MTRFLTARSLEEACDALAADAWGAKAIAGGTALVLMMRQGLVNPDTLVSLGQLEELRGVDIEEPDYLRIGARTTLSEVAASPLVRRVAPSLAYACHRVGNVRVRNVATFGGNVAEADYASDPPSVLVALDATCRVQGPAGQRTVAVRDLLTGFFTTTLEPGELVTDVLVPLPGAADRRSRYHKYISRSSEDRPCVGVAVTGDFSGAEVTRLAVVVGAVAPVPQRFDHLVSPAIGTTLEPAVRAEIAAAYSEHIEPMEDARGSAWYRKQMIEVFVKRALDDLVTP